MGRNLERLGTVGQSAPACASECRDARAYSSWARASQSWRHSITTP